MGLDSVELIMEWEDFFGIKIPDREAEKIGTISNAVAYIAANVPHVKRGIDIKAEVLKDLSCGFLLFNLSIAPTDLIFRVLPIKEEQVWKEISVSTKYEIPLNFIPGRYIKWYDKLFPSTVNYDEVTVDRYADLTCAVNYRELIHPQVQSQYEIMIAVMGMTIEKSGVNPFEVRWDSSFTNDLGID